MTASEIWRWLEQVSDPELPAVSVVDLGIVREIRCEAGTWRVAITPTYTGCPAIPVIAGAIAATLQQHGLDPIKVEMRLSPPWSSDWINPRGRERLRRQGIAPAPKLVQLCPPTLCPRCDSPDTECLSGFGTTPCQALYRCRSCGEPFGAIKPHPAGEGGQ